MFTYIVRRLLQGMLVLFLVSLMMCVLVRSLPAETMLTQLGQAAALSAEDLARARQELGLDRAFWQQYVAWLGGILQGDLGHSLASKQPVRQELGARVILTLHLALLALMISLLLAMPVGILSAVWPDTLTDYLGRILAITGLACPDFWLATIAMTGLAFWWHWVPAVGFAPLWVDPITCLEQLLLPAVIVGARLSALLMRMIRSLLRDVLRQDYIRTARAKGLRERVVIAKHGLKNAAIPIMTLIGQHCSLLLGGAVIVEVIFLLPGVGHLTLDAVMLHDYTMLQGVVMFFAGTIVGLHFLLDIGDAWIDPRRRSL